MYQYQADHNASFAQPRAAAAWTRRLGGKINGGLAFYRNAVYVESFDKRVTALDRGTGAVLWSTRLGGVVMTTPIVADGNVIAGTGTSATLNASAQSLLWGRPEGDEIVALDAGTGSVRWRYRTAGENMPSPALVRINGENAIVFANGDNHVRALELRTGRLLWQREAPGIATMSSAAVHDARVFVVVGGAPYSKLGDSVLALEAASGRILWRAPFGNADCSPTVAYGRVFVEGSGSTAERAAGHNAFNDVAAIDERTGKVHWRWYSRYGTFTAAGSDEQGIAAMASRGMLFQAVPATNEFVAFDARTGRVLWKIRTEAAVKMSAVESRGRLYFGDTGNTFYTVEAKNGRVLTRSRFPSFFSVSSPVIFGGTLYVANNQVVRAIPLGTNWSAKPSMQ